jgi:hypothetical protein
LAFKIRESPILRKFVRVSLRNDSSGATVTGEMFDTIGRSAPDTTHPVCFTTETKIAISFALCTELYAVPNWPLLYSRAAVPRSLTETVEVDSYTATASIGATPLIIE